MRHLAAFAPACLVVAMVTACASAPSQFYVLTSTAAPAALVSSVSISVGPVSVPTVVDRPQIVLNTAANQLQMDESKRWASPLADNITRVVVANLVRELGTARVWAYGQTTSSSVDYQVLIDVQRFDSVLDESVEIDVLWTVRPAGGGAAKSGRSLVREATAGSGFDALVAAHSRALARVSADIAVVIRTS
ncbi:PqiC family protein [Accumulibacter sp.]|uniref:PqiC family protein n=1 Tax=Accumulibacter sp. TaxID=2053492 RepID=UPI0028C3AAB3|nr:PqiC family protein [Accumulibacter sp.]